MIESDNVFMKRALDQAECGAGLVSPNPMVGALLVKDGKIVGEGFHRYDLLKHGETYAIERAGPAAEGATLYCNLEPCCHHGRTPPCTDALISARIARAVIAVKDPDPRVNGRGIDQLRASGIEVEVGLLGDRARRLNESYLKFISTGRPFVHAVIEYTADSARAVTEWKPSTGFLKFASNYDAVMIGSRPELNRIVVDEALNRERHRALVIAASRSEPWLLEALQKRTDGEITVVQVGSPIGSGTNPTVIRMEDGVAHDVKHPILRSLFMALRPMEVNSVLTLPGILDASDKSTFGEFDKVTLAVPTNTYEEGLASRWIFGDIEFDMEDVSAERSGEFTELTGYPSLQEVA
jgi:pyrimidine deaminase RibD-like protein